MPKFRVIGASVRQTDKESGRYERYGRGEIIETDDQEWIDRHIELGVIGPPEEEPKPFGSLFQGGSSGLTEESTDEEIYSWASTATVSELMDLFAELEATGERETAERVSAVLEQHGADRAADVKARIEAQAVIDATPGVSVNAEGLTTRNPATDAVAGTVTPDTVTNPGPAPIDPAAVVAEDDDLEDPDEDDDLDGLDADEIEDPALVVTFSLNKISTYLDAHPEQAQAVLAAEHERVSQTGEEPRVGLLRLVEALAGSSE